MKLLEERRKCLSGYMRVREVERVVTSTCESMSVILSTLR